MKYALLLSCLAGGLLSVGPTPAADETFDSQGVKIRYVTAGEGAAVVLIHGWMSDSSMWGQDRQGNTKLNTKDSEGFQLIAFDCRGHGRSDKPHDPAQYGPEMAADIVRLLDHLHVDQAHLVGYSSGCYLAGWVAAHHPERVRSVLYGGRAPLIAAEGVSNESAEVDAFVKAVEAGKGMGSYIRAVMPPESKLTDKQADSIAKFMFGNKDLQAFAAAGRTFKDLGVPIEQLKACPAPILFIHGSAESAGVKQHVAGVRELLGRGEQKIIEGGDHLSTLAKPEFGTSVVEFLKSAEKQRPPR